MTTVQTRRVVQILTGVGTAAILAVGGLVFASDTRSRENARDLIHERETRAAQVQEIEARLSRERALTDQRLAEIRDSLRIMATQNAADAKDARIRLDNILEKLR